ncbi:MAG: lipopolysaccharide exporter [Bacteroidia bacterium]|jgi:lipopolysaccharide exporter
MKKGLSQIYHEFSKVKNKGSFAQNVSIVFGGNAINLVLQLIFAPIISRIFGPEAYGEYAYYNLVISNIGFFAAMSFPSIYLLPKSRYEYFALAKAVIFSVVVLTALSLAVFFVFNSQLAFYEGSKAAIPIVIALILINNTNAVLSAWNTRQKKFRKNTMVDVTSNILSKAGTVTIGYLLLPSGLGLLFGDLIKSGITLMTQTSNSVRAVFFRFLIKNNWAVIFESVKKYSNVPKFIFPSQLMSKWTADLPILVVGAYYSKEMLGYYVFAATMLNIPSRLFENSIKPVMFKKALETFEKDSSLMPQLFLQTFKYTFWVSILPAFAIALISPTIFPIVFGQEWRFSGTIVIYICIVYVMQAILAPYTDFWRVLRRERELLVVNVFNVLFKLLPLTLVFFNTDFKFFLIAYSISSAVGLLIILGDLLLYLFPLKKAAVGLLLIFGIVGSVYLTINYLFLIIYQ